MNQPPLFTVCLSDAGVMSILGDSEELRLYPFYYVKRQGFQLERPYAVWQTTGGSPENNLSDRPKSDNVNLQIDVYADTAQEARDAANAIEAAIELQCYITQYMREDLEADTKLYRTSFGVEWIVKR